MRKGQLLSIDAMVSTLIFMIMIASIILISNNMENRAVASEEFRIMRNRLIDVSDVLVSTRGNPEYWYLDSVDVPKSIGLAKRDRILSDDRLEAVNDLDGSSQDDYQILRKTLGIGKYDIHIQLLDNDGNLNCKINGNDIVAGKSPSNFKEKVSIDRKVFTEDERVCTLRITAWRT